MNRVSTRIHLKHKTLKPIEVKERVLHTLTQNTKKRRSPTHRWSSLTACQLSSFNMCYTHSKCNFFFGEEKYYYINVGLIEVMKTYLGNKIKDEKVNTKEGLRCFTYKILYNSTYKWEKNPMKIRKIANA